MQTSHKIIHFINFSRKLTVNSLLFLIPLYFLKIGMSGWEIGLVISFYAAAPLLFSFFIGWLNDRFSIRGTVRSGLILVLNSVFGIYVFKKQPY